MTNPQFIRAPEDRNMWPGMDRTFLLASETRSRSSGRGDRLLLLLAYGFLVLALCLLLSDFCRLILKSNLAPDLLSGSGAVHQVHQVRHLRRQG